MLSANTQSPHLLTPDDTDGIPQSSSKGGPDIVRNQPHPRSPFFIHLHHLFTLLPPHLTSSAGPKAQFGITPQINRPALTATSKALALPRSRAPAPPIDPVCRLPVALSPLAESEAKVPAKAPLGFHIAIHCAHAHTAVRTDVAGREFAAATRARAGSRTGAGKARYRLGLVVEPVSAGLFGETDPSEKGKEDGEHGHFGGKDDEDLHRRVGDGVEQDECQGCPGG